MALTTSLPAGRPRKHVAVVALVLVSALLSACSPAAVERTTPAALPSSTPTTSVEVVETPPMMTPVSAAGPRIERVAIATRIDSEGAPLDETSVVSEWPELIYLCVLMSEIEASTRLRAYWFQDNNIIAQSDMSPPSSNGEPAWVALRYRPVARLDPAAAHAVELRLGEDLIDRYLFRVGAGNPADAIAELAFATGFDDEGDPIDARSRFMPDEAPLTLRMRVSNLVDPSGMVFTSLWYRGDAQIASVAGVVSGDGPDPDPRQLEFEYVPSAALPQGLYRVEVLMNGTAIRTARFIVSSEPEPPTATPSSTAEATASSTPRSAAPTPEPTRTPIPSSAEINTVAIATEIDQTTAAPVGAPILEIDRPGGSVAQLWVALDVSEVTPADTIEIVVLADGEEVERIVAPSVSRESGWIATAIGLDVPPPGETTVYTIEAHLNGQEALATTCQVEGT